MWHILISFYDMTDLSPARAILQPELP